DTEHRPDQLDENILWLAQDADVLIYDCNFTEEELARHRGWGHSTWQEGVRIAQKAGVRQLVMFHHDPDHDDDFLDRVQAKASKLHPGAIVASEGVTFVL